MRTNTRMMLIFGAMASLVLFGQRTNVARDYPIYSNNGKPDLALDPQRFVAQMEIVDRYFGPGDCALQEEVVGGTGYRRLLRFDAVVMNRGAGDAVIGNRADPRNPYAKWFYFAPCHGHYHLKDFSVYELYQLDGKTLVTKGTKQGFCFEDSFKYEDGGKSNGYDCDNQGITSGWGDWYYKQLVGQWIDITGVPEGDYIVRVKLNYGGMLDEGENRYGNTTETRIHIPDPRNKVDVVQ